MTVDLPERLLELLRQPSLCFFTTLLKDGSPHTTETWVDTDGTHILINTAEGFQKVRNMRRDPRVSLAIADWNSPREYFSVRGRVTNVTKDGAVDHIERLSQKYLGGPYPWWSGRDQVRLVVTVDVDWVR